MSGDSSYRSRKRQRLAGYDYSTSGYYFITICIQDRLPLLGRIVNGEMQRSTAQYAIGVREHGWPPFPGTLWQRGFFERVIRQEKELTKTREYTLQNPTRWALAREQ